MAFISAAIFFFRLYAYLRKTADRIKQQMGGQAAAQGNGNDRQQQSYTRRTATAQGETIIDNRNPTEVNQKIFKDDEGEYVDYKEE